MNKCLSRKIEFLGGWRAALIRLKFIISSGKHIFQRKKYPLFRLRPSIGGLLSALQVLNDLNLKKIVKFNNSYYFSLTTPRWPSSPFSRMTARGGLNIKAAGTPLKSQIDIAILAITRKCNYDCKHCYEHFNLADEDIVPVERWKKIIEDIQKIGANIIALSGGEPMLRYDGLIEMLESGNKSLSEFHIYTSGHRVTAEKARELNEAGISASAIGLDDVIPQRHDDLRGFKGSYQEALQAIRYFQEARVFTYINLCLTKDLICSGDLPKYFELAKELNVGAIRFLEPKPCGGYLFEDRGELFSEEDRRIVTEFFMEANRAKKYRDYPLISYEDYAEAPERLGCMMGGHTHFHIDSLGNVEPCVFLPISFGNIMEEDFLDIYKRMKEAIPAPLHKLCPSIYLAEKIRDRRNNGEALPVPYRDIETEWQQMLEET